jgi:hypothetical protein
VRESLTVAGISQLRGEFTYTPLEWLLPLVPLVVPVMLLGKFLFDPPLWFVVAPNGEQIGWVSFMAVVFALAVYGIFVSTSTYRFDGIEIICRRFTGHVAWSQPLTGLVSVSTRSGRGTYQLILRWPDRRRVVYVGSGLQSAISGVRAST